MQEWIDVAISIVTNEVSHLRSVAQIPFRLSKNVLKTAQRNFVWTTIPLYTIKFSGDIKVPVSLFMIGLSLTNQVGYVVVTAVESVLQDLPNNRLKSTTQIGDPE